MRPGDVVVCVLPLKGGGLEAGEVYEVLSAPDQEGRVQVRSPSMPRYAQAWLWYGERFEVVGDVR